MRITRKILEKKLEVLKNMSKGKFDNACLDYYALGGGYRIDNGEGYTLQNNRLSPREMANCLDMMISLLHIMSA